MNPRNQIIVIRKLMATIAPADALGSLIENIDILRYGGDLLQSACTHGNRNVLEILLNKGADLTDPPEFIADEDGYRRAPFMLMAASSGDIGTLELVVNRGGSIADNGFITLSKKRKNHVISNVVGCAAWFGRKEMLEFILRRLDKSYLEF